MSVLLCFIVKLGKKIVLVGSKEDWKNEKELHGMIQLHLTLLICVNCMVNYTFDCLFEALLHSRLMWADVLHAALWGCGRDFAISVIKLLLWSPLWAGNWERKVDLACANCFDIKLMCGWLLETRQATSFNLTKTRDNLIECGLFEVDFGV